jgi:hypothetical protein
MDILLSTLIGIPFGILSSLVAWWILFHCIVPKVAFSKEILRSKSADTQSGFKYRLKVANTGKRNIIDVEIIVRYRIKLTESSKTWIWETIKVDHGKVPRIPKGKGGNRIFRIYPEMTQCFSSDRYPDYIRKKAEDGSLSLEDVMSAGYKSNIIIYIFGYDEFSGTRKLFLSSSYDLSKIKEGDIFNMK